MTAAECYEAVVAAINVIDVGVAGKRGSRDRFAHIEEPLDQSGPARDRLFTVIDEGGPDDNLERRGCQERVLTLTLGIAYVSTAGSTARRLADAELVLDALDGLRHVAGITEVEVLGSVTDHGLIEGAVVAFRSFTVTYSGV